MSNENRYAPLLARSTSDIMEDPYS
ncbi:unnamed protein product [Lathyrus sativus]|nr:unnamed protein product [Lathyrus sativus]